MGARIFRLLAGGLLSALLVAGCGGSSGDGADEVTASSLGKAEFVKQADAACRKRQEEARNEFIAYSKRVGKSNETPAEQTAHIATVGETILAPALRYESEDMRALGAPEGEEKEVEAIILAIEGGIAKVEAHPNQAVAETSKLLEPAGRLARSFGLKVCGSA